MLFRLVLVLLPLVLLVGLLEAGLVAKQAFAHRQYLANLPPLAQRALIPSADPGLRVEFNPGFRSVKFTVNAFGMADDDVLEDRTPGVTRIAIFGDSISANFMLEPRAAIFPTLLEDELNRRAQARGSMQRFETLNFGVNSYSVLETLRMAELRVPRFQPDIVIVQLCLNDAVPSSTAGEYPRTILWLRAVDFVMRRLYPHRFWAHEHIDAHYDVHGWANWKRALTGFVGLAEDRFTLAVLFPYLDTTGYSEWDYGRLHDGIAERAKEVSVPLLDLRADFEEAGLIGDAPAPDKDPIHPTPAGHRLATDRIIEMLTAMGALALEE